MESQKDLAIVLRSVFYEERHRIITALTEHHGQVSALAKNSVQSRRFGGSLDLFVASEWLFQIKPNVELYQLTEAHVRQSFDQLRVDFKKLSLASTLNEYIMRIAPQNEACSDLFRLHSNALFTLNSIPLQPGQEILFLNSYLVKLLQWSGNQPQIKTCLKCSCSVHDILSEAELSCLIADAGWICPRCRKHDTRHILRDSFQQTSFEHSLLRVKPEALLDFEISLQTPIRQAFQCMKASTQDHQELFKWIEGLFVFHIPGFDRRPIKSLRFLDLQSIWQHPTKNEQSTWV
jgi:DNA repair protein RecO